MFFIKLKLFTAKSQNFVICFMVSIITYSVVIRFNSIVPDDCIKQLNKYLNIDEIFARMVGTNTSQDVDLLQRKLESLNKKLEVRNVEEYEPLGGDTPWLVVRVHRGLERLQVLVASLAQAAGVDDLLLVFSHSYYDQRINYLIEQIDFCMVLQIFYLNSNQLNPDKYPGFDSDSAKRTMNGSRLRGDPRLREPKHHWWWTVNNVFDRLPWPHTDMVIFIDESSYVLADLLLMLNFAKNAMSYLPEAEVISLGGSPANDASFDRLTLEVWHAEYSNGLAFNRSTWQKISALGRHFCEYDDTSWSHSLMHLFGHFPGERALALAVRAPRVLSSEALPGDVSALRPLCWLATHHLFPTKVQAVVLYGREGIVLRPPDMAPKGNGGWSDHHDVYQCNEISIVEKSKNVTNVPEQD